MPTLNQIYYGPKAAVPPTSEEIAERLAANPSLISADGFDRNKVPKVGTINNVFGVKIDGKTRDEIWAKVQELKTENQKPEE